jgi:RHS repeat-associated protein
VKGLRVTAIVAVVLLLLAISAGIAFAAQDEAGDPNNTDPALSESPIAEPGPEVVADRTATSQTFELPGGALEARIFASPINYRDEQNQWQPIGEGFEEEAGTLSNSENAFDISLPQQMDKGPVRLVSEEGWVASQLTGTATEAVEIEGNSASYEATQPGTSFDLHTLADGIKENIELIDLSQPNSFTFDLEASDGLTPSLNDDGSFDFNNEVEETVVTLPAPVVSDAGDAMSSSAVHYQLEPKAGEGWRLTVEVDKEWLESPARTWPVYIDPTMKVPAPALDCNIGGKTGQAGWGLCGSGGRKELALAYKPQLESAKDEWSRALLRYSLNSVPADAYIASASFNANATGAALNTSGVELAQLTQTKWMNEANWRRYLNDPKKPEEKLWTNEGGDYSTVIGKVLTSARGAQAGWWSIPLSASVVEASAPYLKKGSANNGPPLNFIAKLIDDKVRECGGSSCTQRGVTFESSAAANPENRPYISLVYYAAAAKESKLTRPLDGTVTARRLKLQSALGAGVTGVTYQFREDKAGRFEAIPGSLVKDGEGKEVKWPIALGEGASKTEALYFDAAHATPALRSHGGTIQVRALFDGLGAGYSVAATATVNRSLGGPHDETIPVGPGSLDLITGNLSVGHTDVSISGWGSSTLTFSRTFNSRDAVSAAGSVLGPGWKPGVAIEQEGNGQWRSLREIVPPTEVVGEEGEVEEGAEPYVHLTDIKGIEYTFEREEEAWVTPPELTGSALTKENGVFVFTDSAGNRTVFGSSNANGEYLPSRITQGSASSTQMVYELEPGKLRLKTLIAPTAEGITCNEVSLPLGCRSLSFKYSTGKPDEPPAGRLVGITYRGPELVEKSGEWKPETIQKEVAKYAYNAEGLLSEEWDPRISPALKETYTYEAGGQLKTITPAGQEPWTMQYGTADEEEANGRLISVKRPSLLASPSTAQTTIAYGVPLSGSGLPDMSSSGVAKWGQKDLPVDATAIFPPSEPPSSPPSSYARATIHYMDVEGEGVNVSTPAGAGTTAPSISTTETDEFGNIVRELSAQNRSLALAKGSESVSVSEKLDVKRRFGEEGTQLEEEWGPLHQVRIAETGETTPARLHTLTQYKDQEAGWSGKGLNPHLPTQVIAGASIPGKTEDADRRATETKYNWTLLEPTETIVDSEPGGLKLRTRTAYDPTTGLATERSLPAAPTGGDAHTTKTIYYTAGANAQDSACGNSPAYANLACKTLPAKQPGTSGLPEVLVTRYVSYNAWGEPTETVESPGGKETTTRKTILTYDAAGRQIATKQAGGGTALPPGATVYSIETGLPVEHKFTCESSCEGFDSQALVVAYDKLGRPVKYTDADGSTSETTYDLLGRPATIYDGKGTQKFGYDSTSGLLTTLEDPNAGTFTAAYDADGNMVERGLPNGLVAKTTYDEAGEATKLTYTKVTNCIEGTEKCIWLEEGNERSIYGQILSQTSLGSSQQYKYDKAGRLELVKDTPQGGGCTTRQYLYDADSNRTKMTTRIPGGGGACDTSSEGTPKGYSYDAADRLTGEVVYDNFGRIESLPAKYAGGSALTTSFYANEMVASQSQGGLTNSYQLDSEGRPRQVVQTGTKSGTEFLHYAMESDSATWTERSGTWTRNIKGIGGELAAIRESSGTTSLQLANLHGDIVATASLSSSAKAPTASFEFDEFGVAKKGSAGRYGWLGGGQRRTELPSGVIQMGVRSYVPSVGRFISADPVDGGSANSYDYSNGDPVNSFDPSGEKPWDVETKGPCTGDLHVWSTKNYGRASSKDSYGKFYARFKVNCTSPAYITTVLKITKIYRMVGHDPIRYKVDAPAVANGKHWQGEWGNWDEDLYRPMSFDCLLKREYEYAYILNLEWASAGGAAGEVGALLFPPGSGQLELSAQEKCGHGPY